jgi:Bacterial Ig-like domain
MKHKILGLLAGGLALVGASGTATAATVSVEIEGQSVVQSPTVVTTAASVTKPGGAACTGAVPATALEAAVAGDWDGPDYGVTRIRTENRPFGSGLSSWAVYVNGKFFNDTVCTHSLSDGDKVLFFWSDAYASEGYDEPVYLDAPATARPGVAFTVKVTEAATTFDPVTYEGATTIAPSAGATVSGGSAAATTGVDGTAQVTVPAGPYTLVVNKGNRAPARITGCATTGSDGFCGTSTTATGGPFQTPGPCVTNGHDGFCSTKDTVAANVAITAIAEGKSYAKSKGPRQLKGKVGADASGVKDVRLRLTRNDRGQCSTYDAETEKFKTIKKCGAAHGAWFSVGANADWSYLLPAKLGSGRYVLDVNVTDKAGNKTTKLARGTSRVVFRVA